VISVIKRVQPPLSVAVIYLVIPVRIGSEYAHKFGVFIVTFVRFFDDFRVHGNQVHSVKQFPWIVW
jgi:hypothetical protein